MTEAPATVKTVWNFDPAHTSIEFKAKHMMVTTVKGQFKEVKGQILGDIEDPTSAEIDVEIDAASVDTRNEQRDAHLRSADFLETETYPTITYKSTRIERVGDEKFKVYGNLTIRDVTREIDLDVKVNGHGKTPFGTEVVGISAEGSLNRKDFGLVWNVALETGGWLVGDTLKLDFEIEAVKQS
ncbi:MAG TPA: YceI family protein [Chloroflexota bacterium]